MHNREHTPSIVELLEECRDAMISPCASLEHWHAYLRLLDVKLKASLPSEAASLVDGVLMRMRQHISWHARRDLGQWQMMRQGHATAAQLRADDPLVRGLNEFVSAQDGARRVYHGTVRALLVPIHQRGLDPELNPNWGMLRQRAIELATSWREALVHAMLAHVQDPADRVTPHRQPAVVRLRLSEAQVKAGLVRVVKGCTIVQTSIPAGDAEFWLPGGSGLWPDWRPLSTCLQRRSAA